MQKIEVSIFENRILWFESMLSEDGELEKETSSSINVTFGSNFDYGLLPENNFFIYIDIGLTIPKHAAIMTRSGFTFALKGPTWNDIFIYDLFNPMVSIAIINCYKGLKRECSLNNIELPKGLETSEQVGQILTQNIIDQYHNYRKKEDLLNKVLIESEGLEIVPDDDITTLIKGTFMVLDEILYYNKNFNRIYNREQFSSHVPTARYFTLKARCLTIEQNPVTLTMFDTVLLLLCLDCALQMLLGDRADELIATLEKQGLDKERRSIFFREGTNLFKDFRAMLKASRATIDVLEKEHDWNKMMR